MKSEVEERFLYSGTARSAVPAVGMTRGKRWMTTLASGRGLGFCGWNGEGGFRTADIFEAVVGPHSDRMLSRRQSRGDPKFVVLLEGVADAPNRCNENPVSAIHTILSPINAAGRVSRYELDEDQS